MPAPNQSTFSSRPIPETSSLSSSIAGFDRSRKRRFFEGLGFVLLGTFSALLILEIGYRLLPDARQPASDRPHRFFILPGASDKPHFDRLPAKAPRTFRIVVIGDSFTFGQGLQLDDAFPARLERLLNLGAAASGAELHAEVINAGVRGYSTAQELDLINKALQFAAPDLVILQVTLNDPELQPYRVQHPNLDRHGRVRLMSPIFSYWKSLAYVVERILNTRTHRSYIDYHFGLFNNRGTWARFAKSIASARMVTARANVPLFVTVFPLFSHRLDEGYPFKPLHDKVDALLAAEGLAYLDLRRAYYRMSPERLQILPHHDSHPNEIAHRVAAEAIYFKLVRKKLVPPPFRIRQMTVSR